MTIQRWATTQNDAGGLVPVLVYAYDKWAVEIQNRSGSVSFDRQQRDWNYDYRIKLRFNKSNAERSSDTVLYNGKKLAIKELVPVDEGMQRFMVLRCEMLEDNIYANPVEEVGLANYVYTSEEGGETEFQADALIGVTAIYGSKDGIEFTPYTIAQLTETDPTKKQLIHNSANGFVTWSVPFEAGEDAIIYYL